MAMEMDNCCPICLGSREEASFVLSCLNPFCSLNTLGWAENKPEFPLCNRRMVFISHSVQTDDAYMPRHPVLTYPSLNWLYDLSDNRPLFLTLQHWVRHDMAETFGDRVLEVARVRDTTTAIPTSHGMERELLGQMQQCARVTVRQHSREDHCLLGWQDACAAGGQEGSPAGAPGSPASQGGSLTPSPAPSSSPERSSIDEPPGTSSAAVGGGPGSHPSVPVAVPAEQEEPQEEPGEAVPGPSTASWASKHPPGGSRLPAKRKTGSTNQIVFILCTLFRIIQEVYGLNCQLTACTAEPPVLV